MPMKKRIVRNPSGKNGYVLPQAKLEQREKAFVIYRDMGERRSLNALIKKLKAERPELAVSGAQMSKWSRMHDWQASVDAHDRSMAQGRAQQMQMPMHAKMDANFDQIGALLQAANQALTRAMNASPIVTKPSDVKALVDSATNALKLVETIKNQSTGKVSREDIAQEMTRVLGMVRKARELDIELAVEAELKKRGIDTSKPVKADGEEKPNVEAIAVDAGDGEVVADLTPVVADVDGGVRPGLNFAAVLKSFQTNS
jgi:hypothetical protein